MNTRMMSRVDAGSMAEFSSRLRRIEADGIDATWTPHSNGKFELEEIWSEKQRGCGHASRYMRQVVELADELGVTLTLYVHCLYHNLEDTRGIPDTMVKRWADLDRGTLLNRDLIEWYRRLGFDVCAGSDEDNPRMERLPSRTPSTPKHQPRK